MARRLGRPVSKFLRIEASGGLVLIVATVIALTWANSPFSGSYHDLIETHIVVELGDLLRIDEPLEVWVNDALMAIFFFVVGLEIKRELVAGGTARSPCRVATGGRCIGWHDRPGGVLRRLQRGRLGCGRVGNTHGYRYRLRGRGCVVVGVLGFPGL